MTSPLDEQLRITQDEVGEANVNMKRSHSVRGAQSSGKRINRSPHRSIDRNPTDTSQFDELRNLTAEIVFFPQKVPQKRVRFAKTCKLFVFPRMKAKYDQRIWYTDTDFSNFKKEANAIVESIHSYKGAYDKVITHLGIDCVLGLERIISNKIVESRRQWRLSASFTVLSLQGRMRQQGMLFDGDGVGGEARNQNWSAWEFIAEHYRNAVAESKVYALDLAEVYATSNPKEMNQRMFLLLGSIDCEACLPESAAQPLTIYSEESSREMHI